MYSLSEIWAPPSFIKISRAAVPAPKHTHYVSSKAYWKRGSTLLQAPIRRASGAIERKVAPSGRICAYVVRHRERKKPKSVTLAANP